MYLFVPFIVSSLGKFSVLTLFQLYIGAEDLLELGVIVLNGTSIEVRPEQPLNAPLPIDVTESGIVIEVSPEQSSNA